MQNSLTTRSVNQQYVQLAVSLLTKSKEKTDSPALRAWAVDLLNETSPPALSEDLIKQLKTGEVNFSKLVAAKVAVVAARAAAAEGK
ncbi:MAG: hypothetical protein HY268_12560 [Deltaproteobacteria bacterium]|nr:hypothetical protein [Deltaproteobacteria bacterium]